MALGVLWWGRCAACLALSRKPALARRTADAPKKFAAVSLLVTPSAGLRIQLGAPTKHKANPLFFCLRIDFLCLQVTD